ncbi:undecaprenyl/decaprenyl-phosphate alpha-N-acetylglucosaminyl 1-phosphate transferase [Pelagibacterales bacterium SAG-MED10]|nr:undecaprenyl/decaprenyl-phosphate alpha-N-acetylglucosaminyl 1-phosphate transferase [Pelagibacterales bacterium SAG-MED10]|tara:strand:- start:239 stop:1234 length:996 start_codon:yes stop_codon:yes gene_type:complete
MVNNILIIVVSCFSLFFILNHYSYRINLLDLPNSRKLHKNPVPLIGGIVIGLCLILSVYLFDFKDHYYNIILSYSLLIVIAGVLDDFKNLSAGNKLVLQSLPISILIFKYDFFVKDLGFYTYVGLIELGSFAPIFTLLSIFLFINACNYIDGIDGSLGLIFLSSIMLLYFNISNKDLDISYFYLAISIPVIIFLLFNLASFLPKIFLGDSGSLLLGYLLSCLLIISYNKYQTHPIIIAWSVSLIVYDFLFVNIYRIKNKKIITEPGKDHIQHACIKYTKSKIKSNAIIVGLNTSFAILGILFYKYYSPLASLILFIIMFLVYSIFRFKFFN